jgi:hypothetical protein
MEILGHSQIALTMNTYSTPLRIPAGAVGQGVGKVLEG